MNKASYFVKYMQKTLLQKLGGVGQLGETMKIATSETRPSPNYWKGSYWNILLKQKARNHKDYCCIQSYYNTASGFQKEKLFLAELSRFKCRERNLSS